MFDVYWAEDLIERVEYQCKMGHFDHLLKEKPKNMTVPTLGVAAIAKEREEQIYKHGRSVESDKKENSEFQLADAASALILPVPEGMEEAYYQGQGDYPPVGWDKEIWKNMLHKDYKSRLIVAGALIAAEIDRIS
jgi:hypothetical protein